MKKKGFTLVELLAVVAILAILVIIVLPNVLDMFKESKKESFATEAKSLYDAAIKQRMFNNKETIYQTGELDISGGNNLGYSMSFTLNGKLNCYQLYNKELMWTYISTPGGAKIDNVEKIAPLEEITEYDPNYIINCTSPIYSTDVLNSLNADYAIPGEYIYKASLPGYYKVEVWGAEGGYGLAQGKKGALGGTGSYSVGVVKLDLNETLYAVVGGKGTDAVERKDSPGGYNGGGLGTWDKSDNETSGAGGGASHIAFRSGTLESLGSKDKVLIVAAGGGGGSYTYAGAPAGGYKGVVTSVTNQNAATQSEGYKFGRGEDGVGVADSDGVAGGGAGLYGGRSNNVKYKSAGAGGSGYIGSSRLLSYAGITKLMACNKCEESNSENTKTISVSSSNITALEKTAKLGNGEIKITFLSN